VINQIAAGEVIERPASVVKELVENAVDAGATRIDVAVEQGGLDLVRVTDNGHGIEKESLLLAVASHATSKLQTADDLFCVDTLGFRGEALASIASVSRLVMRSRTATGSAGWELEVTGGEAREPAPCGCSVGTTIEVRNLFYNTPVRRKFLRTTPTEFGHIAEALTKIALAYPAIHFTLRHGERLVHDLPPTEDWITRIAALFETDLAGQLIPVESSEGPVRLTGLVANPTHSRSHPRMQYLFLNGRAIRDRALQHALSEAYRGLLLTGRYPIAFLRIDMPPDWVDVNVHPTKLEVRFQDGGRIYSQLLSTLRTTFLTTDLTARIDRDANSPPPLSSENSVGQETLRQQFVDWAKGKLADAAATLPPRTAMPLAATSPLGPMTLHAIEPIRSAEADLSDETDEDADIGPIHFDDDDDGALGQSQQHGSSSHDLRWDPAAPNASALQLHNRYLITECDDGMIVIDQHALHERIIYEQLREKVLAGALESQSLLVPEPVDLTPAEAATALENEALLAKLGIGVAPFGGDTVLISSYPAMLANLPPAQVLRLVIDGLMNGGKAPDRRDLVDELLHMISCKAAIKAGDRLTGPEITALLESRHLVQDAHHCPHGRPTSLVFTRAQLDRMFKRT
jgi:DNA mismatch repair protein MutL